MAPEFILSENRVFYLSILGISRSGAEIRKKYFLLKSSNIIHFQKILSRAVRFSALPGGLFSMETMKFRWLVNHF